MPRMAGLPSQLMRTAVNDAHFSSPDFVFILKEEPGEDTSFASRS